MSWGEVRSMLEREVVHFDYAYPDNSAVNKWTEAHD